MKKHRRDIFKYKKYYSFEERRLYVDRTEDSIKEEIYHNFLDNDSKNKNTF